MTRWRAALLATSVLATLLVPVAAGPATAAAAVPDPSTLACEGVTYARPLSGDRNPDGSGVRTSRDARGKYVPVVFVHGWTSRSTHVDARTGAFSSVMDLSTNKVRPVSVPRSLIGQVQRIGGTEAFTFDYEPYAARWVTDDHLGPRLGRAIDCLYARTGEKVIVVGHSMGGLVARFAASQPVAGRPDRADRISSVVTFGTPHLGSTVAQAVITGLDVGAAVSDEVAMLRLVLADCGARTTARLTTGSLCDWLPGFLRAFDSDAGRALRAGSAALAALKPFPRGITVDALAGSTTLHLPAAGWFTLPWETDELEMGDMIVPVASALERSSLQKTGSCDYQLSAVRGATDQLGLLFRQTSQVDVAAQPLGALTGPCFHTSLMRTIEITNEATGHIADDVASRQPRELTLADLRNVPVPSLCEHPAGTLVDGTLPGVAEQDGFVQAVDAELADLDGDRSPEGIVTVQCTYGGNADYLGVHVYRRGRVYVGRADLEGSRPVKRSRGISYSDVEVVGRLLRITGYDTDDDDATCCASIAIVKDFAYRSGKLVPQAGTPPTLRDPLRPDGWGKLLVGATYEDAARTTGWPVDVDTIDGDTDDFSAGCAYVGLEGAPGQVGAMGGDGRIGAIVTSEPGVRTAEGVGVGSALQEVLDAYGDVERVDNEYLATDDVVVGDDEVLRFEVDETDHVVALHAGQRGFAMLIEGCA